MPHLACMGGRKQGKPPPCMHGAISPQVSAWGSASAAHDSLPPPLCTLPCISAFA